MLTVQDDQIVDDSGQPVFLRGVCVGGWMNMENFIDGYPGAENGQRAVMAEILGEQKAAFFFERLLDHFLAEEDIAYLRSLGMTAVRLPVNYRHFESNLNPFVYLESGFARLDRVVEWCAKHGLYAIIDLHSVQGWQNPDWHCDNSHHHSFFWQDSLYQDRFFGLWGEFARHYKDNPTIAGYNVMNEPVTGAPRGRFGLPYKTDWQAINAVYRQVVRTIRAFDPRHIIFLEGDLFSTQFTGLDAPFDANLVYSSHNYANAGFGPGPYPGTIRGEHWDRHRLVNDFRNHQGTCFAQQHNVALWVGEFGAVFGAPEERSSRIQATADQMAIFNQHGAHWTFWTYKDIGLMGLVQVDPQSDYLRLIQPILDLKQQLGTDFAPLSREDSPARGKINELARLVEEKLPDLHLNPQEMRLLLGQAALEGYIAGLLQYAYARLFEPLSEAEIDQVLSSFALRRCTNLPDWVEAVQQHL